MIKGWFQQFLVNAAGPVVLLGVLLFLPESFRWYLSSGRTEEGIEALKVYGHSLFHSIFWIFAFFKNRLMLNNILLTVKGQNVALNLIRKL